MPPSTRELILRFTGDSRQLRQTMAALSADLSRFSQGQVTIAQGVVRQTHASELRRIADTVRAANQRLREEQRAGREVARIMAETARQADRQEKIRERAAKQVADVQIREAKRAARELERSLGTGRRGSTIAGSGALDITGQLGSITSSIPIVGRLTSQFSTLTAEAGSAGTAIGAVAGPIALMVAGIGTGIAALFALGKAFFDVVTATAEFQGKFRDLSQQVGVSAESLSTLDFFAETTGGNIETVSASLAIFQKNLEAAHDPTSKEAKLLKDLGVTSLDTETALRQTIRGLSNLGEGSKQTTSALELFGRSGRFVNAIVKESEGDFDKAGQAAAKYGRLVTTEAAIAADKFNDSLIILKGQIAGVTRSLTQDSIPVFIAFFDQISAGLAKNAKDWQGWSFEIAQFTAFTLANLKTLAQFASSGLTIPLLSFNAQSLKEFSV